MKNLIRGLLIAIPVIFVAFVFYKHFAWVKSVDGKSFHGEIVQLSSEMSHGKYPITREYALVRWDDGTSTYFDLPPVHNYHKGDSWVTLVDQSYFDMTRYANGEIPKSAEEPNWLSFWYIAFSVIFVAVGITGIGCGIVYLYYTVFIKKVRRMSLKEFIQKISAEDPCWTSRIGFNFGYDLVDDRDLGNVYGWSIRGFLRG